MGNVKHLVDGEKLIYTAEGNNDKLYLTDKRLIHVNQVGFISKKEKFKDVAYDHISSIEWGSIPNPWFLWIGLSLFVTGIALLFLIPDTPPLIIFTLMAIGAIFVYLYNLYKKSGIFFITEMEKVPFLFHGQNAETYVKEITEIIRQNR